jgi:phosphoglycolate phosphatase-like HAD superfamily hydrolase
MVREVRDLGFRTALVTSKIRDSAGHGLRLLGLEAVIDCVVGADQVAEPKPAAEPVLRAASLLGVAPGDAIMVGDSAHDMASGRAAGAQTAAALWGAQDRAALAAAAPDYWLNDPPDLVPLLQSTLSAPAPP